jgi:hypothetical protein
LFPAFHSIGSHVHEHAQRSYASDGVVSGTADVLERSSFVSVGIFCDDWPSWRYAFSHHCFEVKFICVVNPFLFEDIKNTFCDISVLLFSACSSLLELPPVDVLCFNGRGPIRVSTPPLIGSIMLFDWKFRNRGQWRDWHFHSEEIVHSHCGGASSFSGQFTLGLHSLVRSKWNWPLTTLVGSFPVCNLSGLIKCTVGGSELTRDPGLAKSVPAHTVLSLGRNLFHFKGLFPFGMWRAEFVTPCVFYKLKLARRRLSSSELQEVLDVPVEGVRKRSFLRLLPHFRVPIKVLSAIVSHCLLDNDFSLTRGVDNDFNSSA